MLGRNVRRIPGKSCRKPRKTGNGFENRKQLGIISTTKYNKTIYTKYKTFLYFYNILYEIQHFSEFSILIFGENLNSTEMSLFRQNVVIFVAARARTGEQDKKLCGEKNDE